MAATGTGAVATITGDAAFTVRWRSITGLREFVETLDDTALNTTNYRQSCPDDLKDTDPIELEYFFDGTKAAVPVGTKGTLTIDFPVTADLNPGSTAAELSGSGFIVEATSPTLTPGERLIARLQWKFDGVTEINYTAGT